MIGRTNVGGGGNTFAFIVVTYPAGSICTCTDGTRTIRAKGTTGSFVFNIPYAGTWTVTATTGTKTKSKSVVIDTIGQSESVSLSYAIYIYNSGEEYTQITGGWNLSTGGNQSHGEHFDRNTDYLYIYSEYARGAHFAFGFLRANNKIDLTAYDEVCVEIRRADYTSPDVRTYLAISSADTREVMDKNSIVLVSSVEITSTEETKVFRLPFSLISDYYVGIAVSPGDTNGYASVTINKIWLE